MRHVRVISMYLRRLDSSTFENRALLSCPPQARRGTHPTGGMADLLVRRSSRPQLLVQHQCYASPRAAFSSLAASDCAESSPVPSSPCAVVLSDACTRAQQKSPRQNPPHTTELLCLVWSHAPTRGDERRSRAASSRSAVALRQYAIDERSHL